MQLLSKFLKLRKQLENATKQNTDEQLSFVVECDTSDVAIPATLNQKIRPVAFMTQTLQCSCGDLK